MKYLNFVAAMLMLSGCATCQRYPVACGVAGGIIGTSIAMSIDGHDHREHAQVNPVPRPVRP